jgi:hypothetical protein
MDQITFTNRRAGSGRQAGRLGQAGRYKKIALCSSAHLFTIIEVCPR